MQRYFCHILNFKQCFAIKPPQNYFVRQLNQKCLEATGVAYCESFKIVIVQCARKQEKKDSGELIS